MFISVEGLCPSGLPQPPGKVHPLVLKGTWRSRLSVEQYVGKTIAIIGVCVLVNMHKMNNMNKEQQQTKELQNLGVLQFSPKCCCRKKLLAI